jgi:deoxyadenosine/deoxycytidine kinase
MPHPDSFRNICIIGNVASGKSTLTKLLAAEIPGSVAVRESFEQNPFLELFFQDQKRWAFTNAIRYFYDYVRVFAETSAGGEFEYHFIDAGAPTNRRVYGHHMFHEGLVTRAEHDFYETLCDLIERAYAYPMPDAYIFIESAPETCFQRMQARAWGYQRPITLEYLTGLRKYFYTFLVMLQGQRIPVLKLDSETLDFTSPDGRAATVAQVRAFLSNG